MKILSRFGLALFLCSVCFAVKNVTNVEVKDSISVATPHQSAAASLLHDERSQRQEQSFDLKAVINGQQVILGCNQDSFASTAVSCASIAPGIYSAEIRRDKFVTLHFTEPLSGKNKKQNYVVRGSW